MSEAITIILIGLCILNAIMVPALVKGAAIQFRRPIQPPPTPPPAVIEQKKEYK